MTQPLSDHHIAKALEHLSGWVSVDSTLSKVFVFANFREALAFIVRVAFEAEQLNHHPEIKNVYNKVTLTLSTHDAGNKVTQKDIDLAGRIDNLN